MVSGDAIPLHRLGWHAFQDLCAAVAEECLKRPVQTFLPNNDAGRDGAFIGRWTGTEAAGSSTIQCKYTSKKDRNLSLSMLQDELAKAEKLAAKGLADDYIIMTNHGVTASSEAAIKAAFEAIGVQCCRTFGRDWIISKIKTSPRLRMLAPRLYGLGNYSDLLDSKAYAHAQLVLLEMRDSLEKLVVTEVYRKAVRALNEHSVVLLLGAPAVGKSTIGGSLAVGAADLWQSPTIRVTSPQQLESHLSAAISQFFWIDDAWGSTSYQRDRTESWNQLFPLMQAATSIGSRFLFTSRDYIWKLAKQELKLSSFPILNKSQVVIDVEDFTPTEKAQILFNHLKMGDQSQGFRKAAKPILPSIAKSQRFSPESARRLGLSIFTEELKLKADSILEFFAKPEAFLLEVIRNLSNDARSAIALVFLGGGVVRSPVSADDSKVAADIFGASVSEMKLQLDALNGSILLLAQDEKGQYWTYKHPTIGDAFSTYVADLPEFLEIFLAGAKAEILTRQVICAGAFLVGAKVVVPDTHYELLADRIDHLDGSILAVFLSYRSNAVFSKLMLSRRPDLWKRVRSFVRPIKDNLDSLLLATLYKQDLLPEELRLNFADEVRRSVVEEADSSFLEDEELLHVLTEDEKNSILDDAILYVLNDIDTHIARVKKDWNDNYPPDDHFEPLRESTRAFLKAAGNRVNQERIKTRIQDAVFDAVSEMQDAYQEPDQGDAPVSQSATDNDELADLFRDVDE
jgi:hypothetical protein